MPKQSSIFFVKSSVFQKPLFLDCAFSDLFSMFKMFLYPQRLSKLPSAIFEFYPELTTETFLYRSIPESFVFTELLMLAKIHMDVISEFALNYVTETICIFAISKLPLL